MLFLVLVVLCLINITIKEHHLFPCFKVFSQPIISKAKAQLLKTHFLPLMEKLKKVCLVILLFVINYFVVHQNIGRLRSNVFVNLMQSS